MPVSYDNRPSQLMPGSSAPDNADAMMQALQGNLREKPISYLLKVAAYYEATGHLYVGTGAFNVKVQFGLGKPVNASSPLGKGDEAIIDLFTWSDGQLVFELGRQPESVNILETADGLVTKGEAFIANLKFLEDNFITESSFLIRSSKLSKRKLEAVVNLSSLQNHQALLDMYGNVYGTLNLADVAERMGFKRSEWVAAAAELLKLGLLLAPDGRSLQVFDTSSADLTEDEVPVAEQNQQSSKANQQSQQLNPQNQSLVPPQQLATKTFKVGIPQMRNLEFSDLENSLKTLSNPDTGLLSDETFIFMLSHEFARAHRFGSILTLAAFSISAENAKDNLISLSDLRVITKALLDTKRETDLLGHFGEQSFAFLLPSVDSAQTCIMVDRINQSLPTLLPTLGHLRPMLHFGISTAPTDATSIVALSTMAQANMKMAAENRVNRLAL
jgi:hypothetical protein